MTSKQGYKTRRRRRYCSVLSATEQASIRIEEGVLDDLEALAALGARNFPYSTDWLGLSTSLNEDDYAVIEAAEAKRFRYQHFTETASSQYPRALLVAKVAAGPEEGKVIGSVQGQVLAVNKLAGSMTEPQIGVTAPALFYLSPVLGDLAVTPEYRGQGIARALIAAIEQRAEKWGYNDITLLVEISNTAALAVYSKCGYKFHRLVFPVPVDYVQRGELGGQRSRLEERPALAVCLRKQLLEGDDGPNYVLVAVAVLVLSLLAVLSSQGLLF